MTSQGGEIYVAVDIEADGPIPGPYSMLSLGMAVVGRSQVGFYTEIKPISEQFDPAAIAVNGLDRDRLMREAPDAQTAMTRASVWLEELGTSGKIVFVAAPAVFDGMFVHWYFIQFVGRNPFAANGAGIDLRSFWMGARKLDWGETGRSKIREALAVAVPPHTHNALDDARELAVIFEAVLREQYT